MLRGINTLWLCGNSGSGQKQPLPQLMLCSFSGRKAKILWTCYKSKSRKIMATFHALKHKEFSESIWPLSSRSWGNSQGHAFCSRASEPALCLVRHCYQSIVSVLAGDSIWKLNWGTFRLSKAVLCCSSWSHWEVLISEQTQPVTFLCVMHKNLFASSPSRVQHSMSKPLAAIIMME